MSPAININIQNLTPGLVRTQPLPNGQAFVRFGPGDQQITFIGTPAELAAVLTEARHQIAALTDRDTP